MGLPSLSGLRKSLSALVRAGGTEQLLYISSNADLLGRAWRPVLRRHLLNANEDLLAHHPVAGQPKAEPDKGGAEHRSVVFTEKGK